MALKLFIYGTLKSGHRNNSLLPRSPLVVRAVVRGRLFTRFGLPFLVLPERLKLAMGSSDYLHDARLCVPVEEPSLSPGSRSLLHEPGGLVSGELATIEDPELWLPDIDRLEGFDPILPGYGYYHRVLTMVRPLGGGWLTAWTYAVDESHVLSSRLRRVKSGEWPG